MIQDVKLGTHKIGTLLYVCHQQVCQLMPQRRDKNKIIKESINVGVEWSAVTRGVQVVQPMGSKMLFQIKAEHLFIYFVCTKFDTLNNDGFLISGGCRSAKSQFVITENLHALKHFKT